jgi:hypothetical protein
MPPVYVYKFQLLNQLPNFDEILYERYATGGHADFTLFNCIKVIETSFQFDTDN